MKILEWVPIYHHWGPYQRRSLDSETDTHQGRLCEEDMGRRGSGVMQLQDKESQRLWENHQMLEETRKDLLAGFRGSMALPTP